MKNRDILCMLNGQPVKDLHCKHTRKPRVQKICRMGRCPSWKTGKWEEVRNVLSIVIIIYNKIRFWHMLENIKYISYISQEI